MPVVSAQKLVALQQAADNIRNICILAHVDHGKTSLTDALLATNGIISPKLAGKIRYLDSRPDEQLRGITMESSAISLYFSLLRKSDVNSAPVQSEYLINLIDSPGHIDFSSEVSTASRLCDGGVILVDAVEGVCSQTVTVLRQCWIERIKPLLVINKMDRLVTELKMTPGEAYTHLSQLLEQVNVVMGEFYQGERMEDDLKWRERMEEKVKRRKESISTITSEHSVVPGDPNGNADTSALAEGYEEMDDEDIYFAPENNNVIFSSAVDGWAFTVRQFAALYEKKLGIKRSVLEKVLWGDYYLDPKTKRVLGSKHLKGRNLKPMFVQLVLENVWAVYEATTGGDHGKGDPSLVEKITKSLNLTIPNHILRSRDPRALLTALFAAWLPLPTAILVSVIEHLPSPPAAQTARMPTILSSSPGGSEIDTLIKQVATTFTSQSKDPVLVYVSKMIAVRESELPQNKRQTGSSMTAEEAREQARRKRDEFAKAHADAENGLAASMASTTLQDEQEEETDTTVEEKEDPEHLIGFARIYSGTLRVGDEVWVVPPKFNPAHISNNPIEQPKKVTVTALYLLMGRSLESLPSVPAGVVFGIGGLDANNAILKNGTVCSELASGRYPNLAAVGASLGAPIVRVALEPTNPADLDKMVKGLNLLVQADACAEFEVLPSGEYVLGTAGELHLERCLKDLQERFARCEIQRGEPIVPWRESIINQPASTDVGLDHEPRQRDGALPRGTVVGVTTSRQVSLKVRVRALPAAVVEFLGKNAASIRRFHVEKAGLAANGQQQQHDAARHDKNGVSRQQQDEEVLTGEQGRELSLENFKTQLREVFAKAKGEKDVWKDVVDRITAFGPRAVGPNILVDNTEQCDKLLQQDVGSQEERPVAEAGLSPRDFSSNISYGFQLATAQGPLCHEPMQGIAVFLEDVKLGTGAGEQGGSSGDDVGRLTGEVIKTARDAMRQAFLEHSPRIMLAVYSVSIQASTDVLGRVYGVVTRRRGRIVSETMQEGTPFFTVVARLPIAESFGFSDEMRKRTSGAAQPQLIFAGFEALNEDPFWEPRTDEEMEDLGEWAERENVARRYIDAVRRRKGLRVRERAVDAEKQKTLKR